MDESWSFFAVEFLEPETSSRAKGYLIFSATLLPPSEAFVEDLASLKVDDPKSEVGTDDTRSVCCPSIVALLLVTAPTLPKLIPRILSISAENLESVALEEVDWELIFLEAI